MASQIFTTLLHRQIDLFVATFQDDGNSLFKDTNNLLIHPGEYGMYREQCFRNLLEVFLPREYRISDGFIISSCDNHRTTQCDIIVQNANAMPLTDGGIGKFHPVEDVYAVIEMKSNLSLTEYKNALRKLAEVKRISEDRKNRKPHQNTNMLNHDAIATFLVCNKLNFAVDDAMDYDSIYDGIERKYWHNAILSIEDGLINYVINIPDLPTCSREGFEKLYADRTVQAISYQYAQFMIRAGKNTETYDCEPNSIRANSEHKYRHITSFLALMRQAVHEEVKYGFDSLEYIVRS